MKLNQLVLASSSNGKLAELQNLLKPLNIDVVPQTNFHVEDIEETGKTFIENAILKARHASQQTGCPALADDSGLCVDSLNGAPGLFSARYALLHGDTIRSDSRNNEILLSHLDQTDNRQAYYVCCLALILSAEHPLPLVSIGKWEGVIAEEPKGDKGFGYDPIFIPDNNELTAAELDTSEKQNVSHRAIALRQLLQQLKLNE